MIRLDHIGLAVENIERIETLYERLFGLSPYKRERVAAQNVETVFFATDRTKLEALVSLDEASPIARFLHRHGEGLHHLAFEVEDVEAEMQRLRALGFEPLSATPQPGADGKLIFFLHPKQTHGVLIEFCKSTSTLPSPTILETAGHAFDVYASGSPDAPPLVLMPPADGSASTSTYRLARELQQRFFVLALDHLSSRYAPGALRTLCLHFSLRRVLLCAVGSAAGPAIRFALQPEERVASLVWLHPDAETVASLLESNQTLTCPLLLIIGDRSPGASLDQLLALRTRWPHCSLAVWPGASPNLGLSEPAWVADLIRAHGGSRAGSTTLDP